MSGILRDTQIKLLWTARIDYPRDSAVSEHTHADFSQLLVVLEGAAQVETEAGSVTLAERECCLLPAGARHGFRFERDAITLDFKFEVADPRLAQALPRLPQAFRSSADLLEALKRIFQLSLRHNRQPAEASPLARLRIDAWFKAVLLRLLDPEPAELGLPVRSGETFPMAAYLEEQLDRQVTLQELAERFNFHPHYLIDLFRHRTGLTPIRYHQQVRLRKVKEWLEFTNLTVSEIADRVGWSLPYLSRLFQAQEGVSATSYRQDVLQAVNRDIVLEDAFVNQWRVERPRE